MREYNDEKYKERRRKLRSFGTPAEGGLWKYLKNKQVEGLRFHRQYGIENCIVDFYCPDIRLAIELDGDYHYQEDMYERDYARDKRLWEEFDIRVLRYENRVVFERPQVILDDIVQEKVAFQEASRTGVPRPTPEFGHQ